MTGPIIMRGLQLLSIGLVLVLLVAPTAWAFGVDARPALQGGILVGLTFNVVGWALTIASTISANRREERERAEWARRRAERNPR